MSDAVAAIIYGSQGQGAPRGLRPALDADSDNTPYRGGAELNFAEAMAAFIANSHANNNDDAPGYAAYADSARKVRIRDVADAELPAPAAPGRGRKAQPAASGPSGRGAAGELTISELASSDADELTISELAEPRDDEGGAGEVGELAAEDFRISDMVDDNDEDVFEGFTDADFFAPDDTITVGANMYYQQE